MKLKKHNIKTVDLPDLEQKVTTMDIIRKIMQELMVTMIAEIGQRDIHQKAKIDLVKSYEHLEIAMLYLIKDFTKFKLTPMCELSADIKAIEALSDRLKKL